MTGADAPALRALAGQMSQSAAQLERARQDIRSRLYSINWQGQDGAVFRRAWDAQHGPLLTKVAEGLRATADRLLREADQQDVASGVAGGAFGSGVLPSPGVGVGAVPPVGSGTASTPFDFDALGKQLSLLGIPPNRWAAALDTLTSIEAGAVPGPNGFVNARWGDEFARFAGGHADDLDGVFGNAAQRADDLAALGAFGAVLTVAGAGVTAAGQWQKDDEYDTAERAARAAGAAVVSAAVGFALERGGQALGAAAGAAIGGPVGAVVGASIGLALGTGASILVGGVAADLGAGAVSLAIDVGSAAVDFGRGALEAGGELLDDAGDALESAGDALASAGETAEKAWDKITPW